MGGLKELLFGGEEAKVEAPATEEAAETTAEVVEAPAGTAEAPAEARAAPLDHDDSSVATFPLKSQE